MWCFALCESAPDEPHFKSEKIKITQTVNHQKTKESQTFFCCAKNILSLHILFPGSYLQNRCPSSSLSWTIPYPWQWWNTNHNDNIHESTNKWGHRPLNSTRDRNRWFCLRVREKFHQIYFHSCLRRTLKIIHVPDSTNNSRTRSEIQ